LSESYFETQNLAFKARKWPFPEMPKMLRQSATEAKLLQGCLPLTENSAGAFNTQTD
jgi:hypothetical protein